jgi:hypothetical protein
LDEGEALTGGGLARHGLAGEKSAEVIVIQGNKASRRKKSWQEEGKAEKDGKGEGLNVRMFLMGYGVACAR